MSNHGNPLPPPLPPSAPELNGADIRAPGCYLHLASGLLTRIYREDLGPERSSHALASAGRVACLSGDPDAPLHLLRMLAARHRYHAIF